MGYKMVCLTCRKAFSTAADNIHMPEKCSECGSNYTFYDHKFRPPKKDDIKAWKLVSFLHEHGFTFQRIYKNHTYVSYPDNLEDAISFVIEYKNQATPLNKLKNCN